MARFRLCKNDPIVSEMHRVFKANIVRIPKEKIQPLSVIGRRGNQLKFLGQLDSLLEGDAPLSLPIQESALTAINNTRSNAVEMGFGVEVLQGFLQGFGVSGVGLKEQLKRAKTISFAFPNVSERYVEVLTLGEAVAGKHINVKNPAIRAFLDADDRDILIVDGVYASRDFSLKIEKTLDNEASFEADAIKELLNIEDTKINVNKQSEREFSFQQDKHLTFAFTCLQLGVDKQGNISTLTADDAKLTFESTTPERVQLSDDAAMLELEI